MAIAKLLDDSEEATNKMKENAVAFTNSELIKMHEIKAPSIICEIMLPFPK